MKIAIHDNARSFSKRWIEYCKTNKIEYKLVDPFADDIIDQIKGCDVFMWHHHHAIFSDIILAKPLLFAIESAGVKTFPNFNTGWHFDDKVAQKYLFEGLNIPAVPSHVFYRKEDAFKWIETTSFPKVFKLKGGAGAVNVKLARSKSDAIKLTKKAFGKGISRVDSLGYFVDTFKKWRLGIATSRSMLVSFAKIFIKDEFVRKLSRESGYIYFQEFIPNNSSDTRVIVVGERAFAIKRMVREGDFRASGSGQILYEREAIDERCIQIAFEASKKLKSQCAAYDFVFDANNNPLIIEVSYGFDVHAYDKCVGYWNSDMSWVSGSFIPQAWMIEDLISSTK